MDFEDLVKMMENNKSYLLELIKAPICLIDFNIKNLLDL